MQGWNDFAVVILAAFAEAALRLRRGSKRESVRFMEGPYRVELAASSDRAWMMDLVAEAEGDVGDRFFIDVASFTESICSSSARALDACRVRGIWTRDEETLQGLLSSLYSARN